MFWTEKIYKIWKSVTPWIQLRWVRGWGGGVWDGGCGGVWVVYRHPHTGSVGPGTAASRGLRGTIECPLPPATHSAPRNSPPPTAPHPLYRYRTVRVFFLIYYLYFARPLKSNITKAMANNGRFWFSHSHFWWRPRENNALYIFIWVELYYRGVPFIFLNTLHFNCSNFLNFFFFVKLLIKLLSNGSGMIR